MRLLKWLERPLLRLCKRWARWRGGIRGFWGVYLFDAAIDVWVRHRQVVGVLDFWLNHPKQKPHVRILDVGGEGHLDAFYPSQVVCLRPYRPGNDWAYVPILTGRAQAIPCEDNDYEAVVCVDVLEHIPESERAQVVQELHRVAPRGVLHAPCDELTTAGMQVFMGSHYDCRFQDLHVRLSGKPDLHTQEHSRYGLPKPTAFLAGGSYLRPTQNGPVWLWSMIIERIPLLRLAAAPFLAWWLLRRDKGPFRAAMCQWGIAP